MRPSRSEDRDALAGMLVGALSGASFAAVLAWDPRQGWSSPLLWGLVGALLGGLFGALWGLLLWPLFRPLYRTTGWAALEPMAPRELDRAVMAALRRRLRSGVVYYMAALGMLSGAVVGAALGRVLSGRVVGAVVGTVVGAVVGTVVGAVVGTTHSVGAEVWSTAKGVASFWVLGRLIGPRPVVGALGGAVCGAALGALVGSLIWTLGPGWSLPGVLFLGAGLALLWGVVGARIGYKVKKQREVDAAFGTRRGSTCPEGTSAAGDASHSASETGISARRTAPGSTPGEP